MPRGRVYTSNDERIAVATARILTRIVRTDGCWVYDGAHTPNGYGVMKIRLRDAEGVLYSTQLQAHRIAYEHFIGPIPVDLEIDHLCRNKPCCRPDHLEPVTHRENVRRAMAKSLDDPCIRGHVGRYKISSQGHLRCLECHRLKSIEAYRASRPRA